MDKKNEKKGRLAQRIGRNKVNRNEMHAKMDITVIRYEIFLREVKLRLLILNSVK